MSELESMQLPDSTDTGDIEGEDWDNISPHPRFTLIEVLSMFTVWYITAGILVLVTETGHKIFQDIVLHLYEISGRN